MTQAMLAKASGLSPTTIYYIERGGRNKTNTDVAHLLASALGMQVSEIEWPQGTSGLGRPPLTGKCITKTTVVKNDDVCPKCHVALPLTGKCDDCT